MITVITEKETRKIIDIRENDTIENINGIKTENVDYFIVKNLPQQSYGEIFEITEDIISPPKSETEILREQIGDLQTLILQVGGIVE